MNKRESIDFDFFETGETADRGRPHTRLDYVSDDNDYQSTSSSARSGAGAVRKIEARLPSASTSHANSDSGASSDSSSGSARNDSPIRSRERRQVSSVSDTKVLESASRNGGHTEASKSRQAWSDESLAGEKTPEGKLGADLRHTRQRDRRQSADGLESRDAALEWTAKGSASSAPGNRHQNTLSDPEEITWETDSDVSVSPLNSPNGSPLVTPRARDPRVRNKDERHGVARTACRVTRSANEVTVRKPHSIAQNVGSRDEDKMNLNLLLKALLECDDKPASERRYGHVSGHDKPKLVEAENRRLLQNLLGVPTVHRKDRQSHSKTSQESGIPRVTNASVNRAKEQRRIEMENLALLKRLQSAKPTKELQRRTQLQDYYKQMSYHAPQLRGGDGYGSARSTSSASAATCYGAGLSGSKSQSLQSLRSLMSGSQRSTTARARPASASRDKDRHATSGAPAVKGGRLHHSHMQPSGKGAATVIEQADERSPWEDGW